MKIMLSVLTSAIAILMSPAALAGSCLYYPGDPEQFHCSQYKSGDGEASCKILNNMEVKGRTVKTRYIKGECPTENVILRCHVRKEGGKYDVIRFFYKGASYPRPPEETCALLEGKVL